MSKRKGDVRVLDYAVGPQVMLCDTTLNPSQQRGWEPGAVLNWLALAGWGVQQDTSDSSTPSSARRMKQAPDSTTIMSMEEMIQSVGPNWACMHIADYFPSV